MIKFFISITTCLVLLLISSIGFAQTSLSSKLTSNFEIPEMSDTIQFAVLDEMLENFNEEKITNVQFNPVLRTLTIQHTELFNPIEVLAIIRELGYDGIYIQNGLYWRLNKTGSALTATATGFIEE